MDDLLDRTRGVRKGEELDTARLEAFLGSKLGPVDTPLVVEQFPGGHSNLTYMIRRGDDEFVLRRPPFGSKVKSAHDMGREFRVLSRLHEVYPPAPRAILYCDDLEVIGAPFYIMQRIRGVIIRKDLPEGMALPPDRARRLAESFIDNLATLHGLDYASVGLADLGKPEGYVQRQIEGWIKRYTGSQTDEIPEVEPVSKWLTNRMPPDGPPSLIHNDYKYDNVILDPKDITRIIGVLDWEMCTLGDPMMDLGTTLSYWIDAADPPDFQLIHWGPTMVEGSLTRRQLADRYAERTGRDVSNIVYYYVYALFKTGVIAQQIYYRYHHGMTQDARFAFFIEATKILMRAAQRAAETESL